MQVEVQADRLLEAYDWLLNYSHIDDLERKRIQSVRDNWVSIIPLYKGQKILFNLSFFSFLDNDQRVMFKLTFAS